MDRFDDEHTRADKKQDEQRLREAQLRGRRFRRWLMLLLPFAFVGAFVAASEAANGLRGAFMAFWSQLTDNTASPTGKDRIWVKSSNDHLIFTNTSNSDTDLSAAVGGTITWNACSFAGTWVNYGGSQATCSYGKLNGVVYLKGTVKSGTCGTQVFTLPAGYRGHTGEIQDFPPSYNGGTTFVDITHNTGVVIAGCGANTLFTLDGVSFPQEN
jgi:hypothetical protein